MDHLHEHDRLRLSNEYLNQGLAVTSLTTEYVDFSTGQLLDEYVEPSSTEWLGALETYLGVFEEYEDMILPGYFDFPSTDGIPEDLNLLFKDFAQKYNITAAVPKLFELTGMGVGDIMNTITLYVMQAIGAPMVNIYFGGASSILPEPGNVHELYDRIIELLGEDVLYNTTVVSSLRDANDTGVKLVAQNSNGGTTQISAERLLLAIEPSPENMAPFDLDEAEYAVFSKFEFSNVSVSAVKSPFLPINVSLTNTPAAAVPSDWEVLPLPSFNSRIDYFGKDSNLFRFLMVGKADLDADGAHELVVDGLDKMVDSSVLSGGSGSLLDFAAFENHGPMHARVNASEIQDGFIQYQYALQGRHSTWWTGVAWSAQFTTIVWAFNEELLLKMVDGMRS